MYFISIFRYLSSMRIIYLWESILLFMLHFIIHYRKNLPILLKNLLSAKGTSREPPVAFTNKRKSPTNKIFIVDK